MLWFVRVYCMCMCQCICAGRQEHLVVAGVVVCVKITNITVKAMCWRASEEEEEEGQENGPCDL